MILKKALDRLNEFYAKKAALAQTKSRRFLKASQPAPGMPGGPPAAASAERKPSGGKSILAMLEKVITDSMSMEAEATQAEQEAQSAYEQFVTDSNNAIEVSQKDIQNKSQKRSKAEGEKIMAEKDLDSANADLASYKETDGILHGKCDFLIKNLAERQQSQSDEIAGLKGALAILDGGSFASLLQGTGAHLSAPERRRMAAALLDEDDN